MDFYLRRWLDGSVTLYRASDAVDGLLQVFGGRSWVEASGDEFAALLGGDLEPVDASSAARVEAKLRAESGAVA